MELLTPIWDILGIELGDILDKKSKRILWRHTWLKIFNLVFFRKGTSNTTCTSRTVTRWRHSLELLRNNQNLGEKSGNWASVFLDKKSRARTGTLWSVFLDKKSKTTNWNMFWKNRLWEFS